MFVPDNPMTMARRNFLKTTSLGMLGTLFASHVEAAAAATKVAPPTHRIAELRLQTHLAPAKIAEFYGVDLGLPILAQQADAVCFQAGSSILTFAQVPKSAPTPFYHFAFNIPENKIAVAEAWQLKRSQIIVPPSRIQDLDNFSENIVFFRHWNAHSIFFYDPLGNVVEFIARHTLNNSRSGDFTTADILNISEIAFVVDDVADSANTLEKELGMLQYSAASSNFQAMGDENGLLLFMKKGTKAVFDTGRNRAVFRTEVILNARRPQGDISYTSYPYHLIY